MANLFAKVNTTGQIPEQWKVSKIIPTFKKGNKTAMYVCMYVCMLPYASFG